MRLSEQEEPAAFYSEVRWEVEEAGTLQTNGEVLSATWSRVCVCVCVFGICEFVCVRVISKTSVVNESHQGSTTMDRGFRASGPLPTELCSQWPRACSQRRVSISARHLGMCSVLTW